MNRLIRGLMVVIAGLAFTWMSFSWFEGEKELRVLCGLFQEGASVEGVTRVLETGKRLRFTSDEAQVVAWSPPTLGGARCTVDVDEGVVVDRDYSPPVAIERWAAWGAALALLGLAVFQCLLALGAPLGRGAWGGQNERLGPGARVASAVVALGVLFGAVLVLEHAKLVSIVNDPEVAAVGVWGLVLLFLVSAGLNAASKSRTENRVGVPVALGLAALCMIVAWSGG